MAKTSLGTPTTLLGAHPLIHLSMRKPLTGTAPARGLPSRAWRVLSRCSDWTGLKGAAATRPSRQQLQLLFQPRPTAPEHLSASPFQNPLALPLPEVAATNPAPSWRRPQSSFLSSLKCPPGVSLFRLGDTDLKLIR